MQDGVGRALHWFGSQFSSDWAEQSEQLGRNASQILMVLSNGASFSLPRRPCLGNGLIGSCFVFTPDLQSQSFSHQVGSLNHRFFFRRVGIRALFDRPIFTLAQGRAGFTPGTALLPAVARFVQRMQNGKGA